jgi:septal ring factor EnvC (AmiA/AmiB activator)
LSRDRRAIEGQLASIADQDKALRESAAGQQELAERLLRLQYRQGATDRLRLLLEGRDAATVARHLAYYGYIQKARAQVIVELRDKADKLQGLDQQARERRDALAANEADQAQEAKVLEKERTARAATVQRLAGDIEKQKREIGRLKKDEARLARLVEEIARTLAAKPPPKPAAPGRKVENVADASLSAKPFESLKGKLRMPVKGELVNSFGAPREETGVQWKGLFIRSTTGETVHAIADGRVVYADWLRGFGNLLILDHGGGYMSLYANNEGLVRQVGENVRSGDAVAQVGSSGGLAESGLYFELRRDGKPFDPLKWIVF